MYCDRCKKEFVRWNHKKPEVYGVAKFVHYDGDPCLDEPKDLCESCYTELENWWNFKPSAESEECIKKYEKLKSYLFARLSSEIEHLPTSTRTNWDGCCPDIDSPEIEYVDVTKDTLLDIINKYKAESED
jgi:hypothetical protein